MKRIYLDGRDCIVCKDAVYIKGDTGRYLAKVLRMSTGDVFRGFDGTGKEYIIKIAECSKSSIRGCVNESIDSNDVDLPFQLTLFQSIPRGGKMDTIVRDVSQLGARRIVPVISARVAGTVSGSKFGMKAERLRRISAESAKVSGSRIPTEVSNIPVFFKDAVKAECDAGFIFWEGENISLRQAMSGMSGLHRGAAVNIFVGPEGGYGEDEIALASDCGIKGVSLGKRILKVETAAVIAAAMTIYEIEGLIRD